MIHLTKANYRCLIIWLVAAIALLLCLHGNRFGADVLPDSGDYITAGVRLAHGEGYSAPNRIGAPAPLTWFPPLFSVVIASIETCHWPIYKGVGIFNAGCYAALVAITGIWVWRASRDWLWSAAAAALVLTSHAIYYVHSIVLSEPLFLLCAAACLASVAAWRSSGKRRFFILTGIAISLAMMTRYAGVSLVPAVVVLALLSPGRRWGQRLLFIFLALIIGLTPSLLWSRFHTPPHQSATGRTLQWHPITRDCIDNGIETLGGFVLPEDHALHLPSPALLTIGLLIICAACFFGRRREHTEPMDQRSARTSAIDVCLVFSVIYIAFLVASISFVDADTPLDERLLSPLVVPLVVATSVGLSAMTRCIHGKIARSLIAIVTLLVLFSRTASIRDELRQRQTAEDLAWFPTLQSDTLDSLRDIPATEAVWSDKPCAIYMAYRLRTDPLPDRPADPEADPQSADDYTEAIQTLRDNLTDNGGGWIVIWHQLPDFGDGFLTENDIRKNFVIAEDDKFDDGVLLKIEDPQAVPTTQPDSR